MANFAALLFYESLEPKIIHMLFGQKKKKNQKGLRSNSTNVKGSGCT